MGAHVAPRKKMTKSSSVLMAATFPAHRNTLHVSEPCTGLRTPMRAKQCAFKFCLEVVGLTKWCFFCVYHSSAIPQSAFKSLESVIDGRMEAPHGPLIGSSDWLCSI